MRKCQKLNRSANEKCNHLCASGDLLRLRGEERERRRGDMDLLLRGERLILRRATPLGLFSRERSLPGPASGRGRFLKTSREWRDELNRTFYILT